MKGIGVKITGVGIAVPGYDGVPGTIITNDGLADKLYARGCAIADKKLLIGSEREVFLEDFTTSDEWIRERTGIAQRSIAAPTIATSDLAEIATRRALLHSGLDVKAVERIDLATVTPDHLASPPTVALVAHKLGRDCAAHGALDTLFGADTTVACSSFIAALQNDYAAIASGICRNGIVVGSDVMSRVVNFDDRGFSVVLGDGAGALVLEACDESESTFNAKSFYFGMDGRYADRIIARAGGSRLPSTSELIEAHQEKLWMDGRAVFKEIVPLIFSEGDLKKSVIGNGLTRAGKTLRDINCIFFHQANLRMIAPVEKKLRAAGFHGTVFNNIQRYGNTTSAAIPLLITEAHSQGILSYGDTFMAVVFGGGYSWGTAIGRWTVNEPLAV